MFSAVCVRSLPASRTLLALFTAACLFGCSNSNRVVIYCAHDREFAQEILDDFQAKTGIVPAIRYDTEANKSVGLYEDLVREADRPRCDVHWNNEILATIRLAEKNVLASYDSPSSATFPERWKDSKRRWTAFAARARVLLVNTDLLPNESDWPRRLEDLANPKWRGKVAMAKPMFGTSASQGAILFATLGEADAKVWYSALVENGVRIVPGNKQAAVGVGRGAFAVGMTDTDDALAEIAAGRHVRMLFPDAMGKGVIVIPNTVALIRNSPNPEAGKKLVDYLLSPEVETKLARSAAGQIPLNPAVDGELRAEIEPIRKARLLEADFEKAASVWTESQRVLVDQFSLR